MGKIAKIIVPLGKMGKILNANTSLEKWIFTNKNKLGTSNVKDKSEKDPWYSKSSNLKFF